MIGRRSPSTPKYARPSVRASSSVVLEHAQNLPGRGAVSRPEDKVTKSAVFHSRFWQYCHRPASRGASGALSGFLNLPSCVSVVGNRLLICANLLRSRASPRMLSSRPDRSQSGVNGWYRAVAGHPFYVCFLFALTRWAGRRTIRSSGTGSQMRETASSEMSNPVGSFGSFR